MPSDMTDAERAALFALLAVTTAGYFASEDAMHVIDEKRLASGLGYARREAARCDLLTDGSTDLATLRPLARRLVAMIRSEALHDAARALREQARDLESDAAYLRDGGNAGDLRCARQASADAVTLNGAADDLNDMARKEQTDAE